MSLAPANDGASERQYLALLEDIIANGVRQDDRTGVGTLAVHGRTMRFDLSDGTVPLLTTKRIPWRAVFHELMWFLRGQTNIRPLLQNKVTIWSEWPHARYVKQTGDAMSLEAFEQRVLKDEAFALKWGDLGPVYGAQWRHWRGPDGRTYDQISQVLEQLRTNPSSRRILFHGWNVAEIDQMALPPCHLLYQFQVARGRLSMTLYQRSCDTALGVPFNIASAALLIHLIAHQVGLEPGELFWVGHDVHLYLNHLEGIATQLARSPRALPTIELLRRPPSLFDYQVEDVRIDGYAPDAPIRLPVAV